MKKVIITGADGFVGYYTTMHFLKEGCEVLALDMGETPCRLRPVAGLTYRQCDTTDIAALTDCIKDGGYDTLVHFAWVGSAGPQRVDCELQLKNALDTVACMRAAKAAGCTRFVGAGSIMEYEVEATIGAQGSRPGMGYVYGIGKQTAHALCKTVANDIGIELLWPMITNAYGVGEFSPRFVNTTLRKMINGEPLEFTAGTQNYDFVYVTDVAKAFYLVAKHGKPNCAYLIGSGEAKPLREFICEMVDACAPHMTPHFGEVPFTGTNMPLCTFDIRDLEEDCGYAPEVPFSVGTRLTMEWLKTL